MNKILIIDGGPRKTFNTASMLKKFAEGAASVSDQIEVNTYQVKNYDNYELRGFSEPDKRQYREAHWEEDLQKAFDAGKRMAEHIMTD